MGSVQSGSKETKAILLGLNDAGKTSILYRLTLGTCVKTQPTIGSNVESVTVDSLRLQVWDVGGQQNLR